MKPVPAIPKRMSGWLFGAVCILALGSPSASGALGPRISLVMAGDALPPAQHGWGRLRGTLRSKGAQLEEISSPEKASGDTIVVAGVVPGVGVANNLATEMGLNPGREPESLCIRKVRREDRTIVLVTGADSIGLMYGILGVAERVGWADPAEDLFGQVQDMDEKPYTSERALSVYTFNRAYWESRFYDEAYWTRYLEMLARNRFNSLVVIFGYENGGFLAPCYPYFFNLKEFPDVRMVGITPEQQQRNLKAMKRLIEMAHDRGIRITVGIWDHIYRGGVQGGGIPGADEATRKPVPGLVWGVTGENLVAYTKAALAEFVRQVPNLDGIQFRMHDESGLKNREQEAFWRDVFLMMKQSAPKLRLDLRAKGLPDSVIQSAITAGVPFRITTKYWMEQMGMPFHPTHINKQNQFDRRHSYSDLLSYPQRYRMHWRLWNGGTARVLLWGDPDYARRFAKSTHLFDGDGFEVNEPLCTKMEAQPHDADPFELLAPSRRYYDYEFERYWHFFQVFGRLGYNPRTAPEVWDEEFDKRFGNEAAPHLKEGLHLASRVLPRIVASCYPYSAFPMTRGWAEKQRLGDLSDYAKAEGSDIQQFASFDEEAKMVLEGGETAKVRPTSNSAWFAKTAADIEAQVGQANERIGSYRNKELDSTITDLGILANLALYHSRRIPAAVTYRLFERTKDPQALDDAITYERSAVKAWRQLVQAAGDFYADDLMMGVRGAHLCGHWRDELVLLEKGLIALETQRQDLTPGAKLRIAPRYKVEAANAENERPTVIHQLVPTSPTSEPLVINAEVRHPGGMKWVRLHYRNVNQHEDYRTLPMLPTGERDQYRAMIPIEHISPKWDLMYFIEAMTQAGIGTIYPDLEKETPYIIVNLQR